eukprot:4691013-Amphidinium_carterae.1
MPKDSQPIEMLLLPSSQRAHGSKEHMIGFEQLTVNFSNFLHHCQSLTCFLRRLLAAKWLGEDMQHCDGCAFWSPRPNNACQLQT